MWTYLQIYFYCVVPVALICVFFGFFNIIKHKQFDNIISGFFVGAFGVLVLGFPLCGIFFEHDDEYWTHKYTHKECKLVSLSNGPSVTGSLYHGTGNISGDTSCSFAVEWPDKTITIITESTKKIIFVPTKGETSVEHYIPIRNFPRSVSQRETEMIQHSVWRIYLPKESINTYIKFN